MKTLIISLFLVASSFAYADAAYDQGVNWLQSLADQSKQIPNQYGQINDYSYRMIKLTGNKCSLYFTYNNEKTIQRVVVGDDTYKGSDKENDSYVGVAIMEGLKVEAREKSYLFERNRTWSPVNITKYNRVIIDLGADGKPVHVTGVSDKQTIDCELN
jgi:hypothetical protein